MVAHFRGLTAKMKPCKSIPTNIYSRVLSFNECSQSVDHNSKQEIEYLFSVEAYVCYQKSIYKHINKSIFYLYWRYSQSLLQCTQSELYRHIEYSRNLQKEIVEQMASNEIRIR